MSLREKAPLLAHIWPYALALGSGVALVKLLKYVKEYRGEPRRTRHVRFAVSGKPQDEDNYVFRDGDQEEEEEEVYEGQESIEDHGPDTLQVSTNVFQ